MFVVIAYDIPLDKRRTRVCNTLKNYGLHVQESVFECNLKEKDYQKLRERLGKLIKAAEDNVRFYFLCEADVKRIEGLGRGKPVEATKDFYVV